MMMMPHTLFLYRSGFITVQVTLRNCALDTTLGIYRKLIN